MCALVLARALRTTRGSRHCARTEKSREALGQKEVERRERGGRKKAGDGPRIGCALSPNPLQCA
jgi:hypothetical protein